MHAGELVRTVGSELILVYSLHQDAAEEAGARAEVIASRHDELDERAEVVAADEAPSTRAASNVSRLWVGGQRTAPQRAQRAMYVQDSLCTRGCLRYPAAILTMGGRRAGGWHEGAMAESVGKARPWNVSVLCGMLFGEREKAASFGKPRSLEERRYSSLVLWPTWGA